METTKWENYGAKSGNPQCANCMVHSGHEASGGGLQLRLAEGLSGDGEEVHVPVDVSGCWSEKLLNEWKPAHAMPLVQIQSAAKDATCSRSRETKHHGDRAAGTSED